jgi:AcrR family transcriptional regulator
MHTTRARIREAAVSLFAARGFAATGIREIAQEAGIASSVLYHYFKTKDDLLVEIMRVGLRTVLDLGRLAIEGVADPAARLAILAQIHVAIQTLDPRAAAIIDGEVRALSAEARREIVFLRDQYEQLWQETLTCGLAQHLFDLADSRLTRLALLEMCNGVAYWYSPTGFQSLEAIMLIFADLVLGAVRARKGSLALRTADLSLKPPAYYIALVNQIYRMHAADREEERSPG